MRKAVAQLTSIGVLPSYRAPTPKHQATFCLLGTLPSRYDLHSVERALKKTPILRTNGPNYTNHEAPFVSRFGNGPNTQPGFKPNSKDKYKNENCYNEQTCTLFEYQLSRPSPVFTPRYNRGMINPASCSPPTGNLAHPPHQSHVLLTHRMFLQAVVPDHATQTSDANQTPSSVMSPPILYLLRIYHFTNTNKNKGKTQEIHRTPERPNVNHRPHLSRPTGQVVVNLSALKNPGGPPQTPKPQRQSSSVLRVHIYHTRLNQVVINLAAPRASSSRPWGRRGRRRRRLASDCFLTGRGVGHVLPHLAVGCCG